MQNIIKYPKRNEWAELTKRPVIDSCAMTDSVLAILNDVKYNGDSALKKYSLLFDKVQLDSLEVTRKEFAEAEEKISKELSSAILLAKRNIEKFHLAQKEKIKIIETTKGVKCWRKSVPIEKVGLYIPGGSAPLFSTTLMLGIPAKIAECKEIILCTPASLPPPFLKERGVNPTILYIAKLLGIKKVGDYVKKWTNFVHLNIISLYDRRKFSFTTF